MVTGQVEKLDQVAVLEGGRGLGVQFSQRSLTKLVSVVEMRVGSRVARYGGRSVRRVGKDAQYRGELRERHRFRGSRQEADAERGNEIRGYSY
jgi:hypothetical protein